MLYKVTLVRSDGWVLPRFRGCMFSPVRGHLIITEEFDAVQRRTMRVARLHDPDSGQALPDPPALRDVQIVAAQSDYITLSGFERHDDVLSERQRDVAQSWMLEQP